MADPLALFAGDSDSDSDSSDNDDELAAKNAQKTAEKKPQTKPANALPDPLSLLASTGRPSFLDRPHEKGIDWERRTVKAPEPPPDEEYVPYSYRAKGSAALPAVSSHTTTETYEPTPPAEDPASERDFIQKEMRAWNSLYQLFLRTQHQKEMQAWNSLYQYEPESLVNVHSHIHSFLPQDPTSEGDRIQKEMRVWNSLYQYKPESLIKIDSVIHLSLTHSFPSFLPQDPTSEGDRIQKEMKAWNSLYQYEPESLVNVSEEDKAVAKLIAEEAVLENMELNAAQKRAAEEDREAERGASGKKLKSETFRHKEKRKRDLGMANREKSYVEEEKRILRQSFGDT
uniref:Uncharacterized protein n=1 Tax=Branchiostoma floridae TaxID=7739 RepID=C3ZRG9_BRAFL|eukprot:XP_002588758.1 hypothetical protein BRAFLDRAFT_89815 [Branchiostoma floridae]